MDYQHWKNYGTGITRQHPHNGGSASRKNSQESIAQLAERYALKPKTVAKCKKKDHLCNAPMGPKNTRSSLLNIE